MSVERDWLSEVDWDYMLGLDRGPTQEDDASKAEVQSYNEDAERFLQRTDQIGKKMKDIEEFYSNKSNLFLNLLDASEGGSSAKDRYKRRRDPSLMNQWQDVKPGGSDAAKRKQDLMRQFGTLLQQITESKWAKPFMEPVDHLGLHDYYKIIKKPMDFRTIKNRMEAKDGSGYKNVREVYADVRLVFKNAIKYNGEKHCVSVLASKLLDLVERKWLCLLPKVTEEENRLKEEEAQARLQLELAQKTAHAQLKLESTQRAAHAQTAKDIRTELYKFELQLDELREKVIQKCRKMSPVEKRTLSVALSNLSNRDLPKALEIVAQNNPSFQILSGEMELDLDAQNEDTLWRLNFFLNDVLEVNGRNPISFSAAARNDATTNVKGYKRKRVIAKTAKKKCK